MSKDPSKEERLQVMYNKDGRNTSSSDPEMMESRIFIGNLASKKATRHQIEEIFTKYGNILGVSLHKSYGFVQFDSKESALAAVKAENGNELHGLKMDICIATERRKDGGGGSRDNMSKREHGGSRRRSHRSRSRSPYRRFRSQDQYERDYWGRYDRFSPPPRLRGPPPPLDPYRDPYPPRDPYLHPRDDPYERYPRDYYDRPFHSASGRRSPPPPPYFSDYPPPPPGRRDRYELDPWDYPPSRERDIPPLPFREERELPKSSLGIRSPERRSPEMQIIVVNSLQKEYAQMVRDRVEIIGIIVETTQLSPTVSLAETLDSAARRGLLYTVIITNQHEAHRSVTLTILHGRNPQEHKNMPLDDAIGLIDRDFERYCQTNRGNGGRVTGLMAKAAAGHNLTSSEINVLINNLQQKQKQHHRSGSGSGGGPSRSHDFRDPLPVSSEDIQQQQADLQAKILSLLGSNAVVPTSAKGPPKSGGHYIDDRSQYRGGSGMVGYHDGYASVQGFGGYR